MGLGRGVVACGSGTPKPAAPAPRSGALEHAMENCPSAVPGARTTVRDVDNGVVLDIVADDASARDEIRARAAAQARMGAPSGDGAALHTGEHAGPGTIGHCPVVHDGTTVTEVSIDEGVRVTVVATDPARTDAVRADVHARVAALATAKP